MEAMSLINLNPTNKEEAKSLSTRLINAVQEGAVNPLELYVKLKAMQQAIIATMQGINDNVIKESNKYGERTFTAFSASIERAELGVKYDYASCNDEVWNSLNDAVNKWSEAKKEREEFLRKLKEPMSIVTADGEVITICPPVKTSTSGIKVTLK